MLFILVLHTTREGFEDKEEKKEEKKEEEDEDAKEEGDAVEKKDVADMTPEEIEAEAEQDITSIPENRTYSLTHHIRTKKPYLNFLSFSLFKFIR